MPPDVMKQEALISAFKPSWQKQTTNKQQNEHLKLITLLDQFTRNIGQTGTCQSPSNQPSLKCEEFYGTADLVSSTNTWQEKIF